MKLFSLLPRRLSHFACNSPSCFSMAKGAMAPFLSRQNRVLFYKTIPCKRSPSRRLRTRGGREIFPWRA